ncbi:MAG TPA: bifunctional phosphopantothenoylcysteine decarboxylase/phosphopantothenate--cysteine ligase CoaBC [Caldilineaceae bacterium]|nr:bifunctional phosphopantothenoylcysteine decarboxylase/phosphopantothenate--cysteine ligase CoaBC [Caldilineaceae bacterium]
MPLRPLQDKRIVLGVSGSIAAYKAADLASKLAQAGAQVDTILTRAALHFITPLTFQSVTGRRAYTDDDLWGSDAHVLHVGLAHNADLLAVAPATANTLAKLAHGLSDDLLGVTALAATCPLLVAPAMDGGMFAHPATQANLELLQARGATVVGPEEGHLASGLTGRGRMSEPATILDRIRYRLTRGGPLAGRKVVVTAGGTREPVDPVRYLTNRSSGKQGYAIAQAALDAGAEVTLISTVESLPLPAGAQLYLVETAQEMADAVLAASAQADALVMAAAVADFRPAQAAGRKIKKESGPPTLELAANPDILLAVAQQRRQTGHPLVVVGFAAETDNLLENAQAKLERKGLTFIVANDVSAADAGFAVDTNRVTLIGVDGWSETLPLMSKADVAERVIQRVARALVEPADVRADL